jgi:hypothetical protein
MSAPDTNIEKQEKRHKPSLLGIKGAMLLGVVILFGIAIFTMIGGGDDIGEASSVDEGATTAPAASN